MSVDKKYRLKVMSNHSSLHLLQSALRKVLGSHVAQAGSYVCDEYARFDFSHYEKITREQLNEIESLVNKYIAGGYKIKTEVMSLEDAKETNAIALFDEKYGDTVRVVSMGTFSKEFCGGTHARRTSDLGSFKIVSEESIGSGIRRIVCKTKYEAYKDFKKSENSLIQMMNDLKLKNVDLVPEKVNSLVLELKDTQSQLNTLLKSAMELKSKEVSSLAVDFGSFKYIILKENDCKYNLREYAISIRNKIENGLVLIFNETNEKYTFICAAGDKAIKAGVDASVIMTELAAKSQFKGGGKNDFVQAGSPKDGLLDDIITDITYFIKSKKI